MFRIYFLGKSHFSYMKECYRNCHSIQNDYRQTLSWGTLISNYRYRIVLPEEYFPLQRQICGNVGRTSLIIDTDSPLNSNEFPLQIQTSDSKPVNSVMFSATTGYFRNNFLGQHVCRTILPPKKIKSTRKMI